MTAAELCRVEPSLLGELLQTGSKKQCAICGGRLMCKQVIAANQRQRHECRPFFACAGCQRELARSHDNLINEDHFVATLKKLKKFKSVTIIDMETSGLLNLGGEIVEIGAVKYKLSPKLAVDGLFFQRVKPPEHEFDPISIGVNGITPAMLADAPPPEEVLPKFLDFISDSLVVAHRALFDVGFINWYCDRYGFKRPRNPVLDTFKIGKQLYGEDVRLDGLLKRNKIRVPVSRHKSWVDCLTTSEAFFKMVRWYSLAELAPLPFAEYDPSLYIPIR